MMRYGVCAQASMAFCVPCVKFKEKNLACGVKTDKSCLRVKRRAEFLEFIRTERQT
jgi:hypothetical protein